MLILDDPICTMAILFKKGFFGGGRILFSKRFIFSLPKYDPPKFPVPLGPRFTMQNFGLEVKIKETINYEGKLALSISPKKIGSFDTFFLRFY